MKLKQVIRLVMVAIHQLIKLKIVFFITFVTHPRWKLFPRTSKARCYLVSVSLARARAWVPFRKSGKNSFFGNSFLFCFDRDQTLWHCTKPYHIFLHRCLTDCNLAKGARTFFLYLFEGTRCC